VVQYTVNHLGIPEIPGLNIGPKTGYGDWNFHDFSQSISINFEVRTVIMLWQLPLIKFLIHYLLI